MAQQASHLCKRPRAGIPTSGCYSPFGGNRGPSITLSTNFRWFAVACVAGFPRRRERGIARGRAPLRASHSHFRPHAPERRPERIRCARASGSPPCRLAMIAPNSAKGGCGEVASSAGCDQLILMAGGLSRSDREPIGYLGNTIGGNSRMVSKGRIPNHALYFIIPGWIPRNKLRS
jgi:hypothetical protein